MTKSEEDLREEFKQSGLYLEWEKLTSIPQQERDKWVDVLVAMASPYTATVEEELNSAILVHADLMWCLGKLRGLGYPNEKMEHRWGVQRLVYLNNTQAEGKERV